MVGGFFEVEKGWKTAGTSLFLVNVKFEKMKPIKETDDDADNQDTNAR